jgi:MFS transporter, ACS family, hexuronate transporter
LLVAGRLMDRLGTRIGYMLVMATWSLSAMGHALAGTVMEFEVARVFLGLGESGNFPAAIKTVAEWFPQSERSLATGIFNSGANVGAILAPAIVPWVTLRYGWHAAFLTTGGFSVLWILWWFRYYRKPEDHSTLTARELEHIDQDASVEVGPSVKWGRLFGYRQTWAYSAAKFLTDPIWWFYLFWLPSYFSAKFNLNLSHLGLPLIIVYNVSVIGSVGGGWLPALFRRFGLSPNSSRLAAMLVCASLVIPIFTATSVGSLWTAVTLIGVAAGAHQGWSANLFTTTSDMFPRNAVGAVVGIGGMAGSVGSALFALLAGHVLQLTHSYRILFGIASTSYLLALLVLGLLAPGLKKVVFSV